jgi:hypothetical protein
MEQREIPQEVRILVSFTVGSTTPSSTTLVAARGLTDCLSDKAIRQGGRNAVERVGTYRELDSTGTTNSNSQEGV